MVKVKQFQGTLCDPQIASELASQPYDTITRKEAQLLSNNLKHSYYHVIRPEIDLPNTVDEHDPQVYKLARANLQKFITEGYIVRDTEQRFYAYEIEYKGHKSLGVFLLARIKDYEDGLIKRHELTRQDKELDRTKIIDIQEANAEPILLTYPQQDSIEEVLSKAIGKVPTLKAYASDDQSTHQIWKLSKDESNYLEEQFTNRVQSFYIADGHHRMAASTNVANQRREEAYKQGIQTTGEESYEYVFAFCVSFNNLKIMPYNRLIKSLKNKTEEEVISQIQQVFDLSIINEGECIDPQVKGEYSLKLKNNWYKMVPKPEVLKNLLGENPTCDQKLDVSILQQLCISPILGIKDIRTDKNIDFLGGVEGSKGLQMKLEAEQYALAISCYPVQINEIVEISDKKKIMLPKATWIIPKPRSGLVVRFF